MFDPHHDADDDMPDDMGNRTFGEESDVHDDSFLSIRLGNNDFHGTLASLTQVVKS